MAKKRTSLDSLFETAETVPVVDSENELKSNPQTIEKPKVQFKQSGAREVPIAEKKGEIVKQTVYLPPAVHEQLRQLAFEERRKMHDYLIEGLDRVFKDRGLKPYVELTDANKRLTM